MEGTRGKGVPRPHKGQWTVENIVKDIAAHLDGVYPQCICLQGTVLYRPTLPTPAQCTQVSTRPANAADFSVNFTILRWIRTKKHATAEVLTRCLLFLEPKLTNSVFSNVGRSGLQMSRSRRYTHGLCGTVQTAADSCHKYATVCSLQKTGSSFCRLQFVL